jgi:hypothetical protein
MHIYLGGWVRYMIGAIERRELFLSSVMDEIEAIEDARPKTKQEIELKSQSNANTSGEEAFGPKQMTHC